MQLQGQVHVAVRKLLAYYGDQVGSITVTGHSLGGALATQCAFDIVRCPSVGCNLGMLGGALHMSSSPMQLCSSAVASHFSVVSAAWSTLNPVHVAAHTI